MLDTINLKGNQYATVPTRLKAFRESNPRASVETKPTITESGQLIFEARIIVDNKDPNSATSTGHSYGKASDGDKAFEKLETVAVGRALSLLGYLNNGQVASTEEMEEFADYVEQKYQEAVFDVHAATTRDQFTEILSRLKPEQKKLITPIINQRIKELQNESNASTSGTEKPRMVSSKAGTSNSESV